MLRLKTILEKCLVGKHCHVPDDQFDPEQLAIGIRVEMEHTKDPKVAKEVAKDHLAEDGDYYKYLIPMEKIMKQSHT